MSARCGAKLLVGMATAEIYNLDLGEQELADHFARATIGPFQLEAHPDYLERRAHLSQKASRRVRGVAEAGKPIAHEVEDVPAKSGELVATVRATYGEPTGERSILQSVTAEDQGIADLCALLSFANGRPVSTDALLEFHKPDLEAIGNPIGHHIESMQVASCLWNARVALVEVALAVHYYNGGVEHQETINGAASFFFTALNILWDKTRVPNYLKLEKGARRALCTHLQKALEEFEWPDERYKARYLEYLTRSINQDQPSAGLRIGSMLKELGIVDEKAMQDVAVAQRVRDIAAFRNYLLHAGRILEVEGLSPERILASAGVVGMAVLPSLVQLRVLSLAGCAERFGTVHQALLREYFLKGTWNGYDPGREDLHQYLDRLALVR